MVKKSIKKETFIKMYREMKLHDFIKEVGISTTTLYRILDKYDIPRNRENDTATKVTLT